MIGAKLPELSEQQLIKIVFAITSVKQCRQLLEAAADQALLFISVLVSPSLSAPRAVPASATLRLSVDFLSLSTPSLLLPPPFSWPRCQLSDVSDFSESSLSVLDAQASEVRCPSLGSSLDVRQKLGSRAMTCCSSWPQLSSTWDGRRENFETVWQLLVTEQCTSFAQCVAEDTRVFACGLNCSKPEGSLLESGRLRQELEHVEQNVCGMPGERSTESACVSRSLFCVSFCHCLSGTPCLSL